jgi:hypothetical protein
MTALSTGGRGAAGGPSQHFSPLLGKYKYLLRRYIHDIHAHSKSRRVQGWGAAACHLATYNLTQPSTALRQHLDLVAPHSTRHTAVKA